MMSAKIPSVQQPLQLKTLDDLMAQAGHYAEFCMRNSGKMAPTLFLIGADGPLMFVPNSLADEDEKDAFATTARLMCITHAATACVMALEAWMKVARPGEKFDMTEPPSEAFDRQEVIVLMGEDRTGPKQKFLPIIRSDNGRFFGFNESNMPQLDSMEGRFAGILPPKVAIEEHRTLAKAMLRVTTFDALVLELRLHRENLHKASDYFSAIQNLVQRIPAAWPQIREWCFCQKVRSEGKKLGLESMISRLEFPDGDVVNKARLARRSRRRDLAQGI